MGSVPLPSKGCSVPTANKRIFVYGSLRRGEYNHQGAFASGVQHVADGRIKGAILHSLGAYPCIVASKNDADTVVGEVYDLADDTFNWVERMELGAGYIRRPVEVDSHNNIAEDGEGPIQAEAYFYPYPPTYGHVVASGDWSKRDDQET